MPNPTQSDSDPEFPEDGVYVPRRGEPRSPPPRQSTNRVPMPLQQNGGFDPQVMGPGLGNMFGQPVHIHVHTGQPTQATELMREDSQRQGVMPRPWYVSGSGAVWVFLMLALLGGAVLGVMWLHKQGVL